MQQQSEETSEANKPFPAAIYKQAETYQLGIPQQVYRARFRIDPYGSATLLTLLIILVFSILILLFPLQLLNFLLLAFCLVLIIWGIAIAHLMYLRQHRYHHVYVCNSGILCQKGELAEGVHWHHIEALIYDKKGICTVHRNDGEQFVFAPPLQKLGELSNAIENAIIPHHLPRLLSIYREGLPIVFGPLRINAQGIGISEQNITLFNWESLTDMERHFNELYLKINGIRRIRLPLEVAEIPSVCVVQALVRTLLSLDEKGTAPQWANIKKQVQGQQDPTQHELDDERTQELLNETPASQQEQNRAALPEQGWTRVLGEPVDAGNCNERSVVVYERGFIYLDKKLRTLNVIRWSRIEKVMRKAYRSDGITEYSITVHRSDGATFLFPHDSLHIAGLGLYIEQRVAQWIAPAVIEQYEQGDTLTFGKLKVSRQGLHYNKSTMPWSEVYRANILSATTSSISIRQRGQQSDWQQISVNNTPNVYLLKLLIEYAIATNMTILH